MNAPQIILLVIIAMEVGFALAKDGEPRIYSARATMLGAAIWFFILWWGGFFDAKPAVEIRKPESEEEEDKSQPFRSSSLRFSVPGFLRDFRLEGLNGSLCVLPGGWAGTSGLLSKENKPLAPARHGRAFSNTSTDAHVRWALIPEHASLAEPRLPPMRPRPVAG